jgi:tetratricopeptide (TPR) repeat protein
MPQRQSFRASAALALFATLLLAGGAHAACALEKILELPVTMTDRQPLVAARINGAEVTLLADSGAFFSQITAVKVAELGMKAGPPPVPGLLVVTGVGGTEKVAWVRARSFSIAGQDLAPSFLVGGGETGHDAAGVVGQNILGFADVEYDLAHGLIRITQPHDCLGRSLAYWADGQTSWTLDIEAASARRTFGMVYVNGVRMRALFDTGAWGSMLTLPAARRVGFDPHASGVVDAGPTRGIGRHLVESWIAPVDSVRIGGEDIRRTRLRVADTGVEEYDMLLGADFFLSHRVFVANDQRKLYFTYNGGPVFNLGVDPTVPNAAGLPSAAVTAVAEPSTAADFARRGAAFTSRHEYDKAVADLTRAVDLAPNDPTYLFDRARAYQGDDKPFLAMADLDKSLALKPDDIPALTARAQFRLAVRDKPHALADLAAAARLAPRGADVRLALAELYQRADEPDGAIGQLDLWIATHPEDSRQSTALVSRCFIRALWNEALDLALADCDAALRREPGLIAARGARGLVRLRQGDPDKAAVDLNATVAALPRDPWALYGRGLARLRQGQTAEGKADLAAALALQPDLDAQAKVHGLAP